ncbi:methyltransferase [Bacillus sp. M6-12]|uniref:RraA family protein n=1 Tax=Bacillus sp. M6-12 TaxID=2054166 RepID=UPI000C78848D|nr:RraA family protein [Bacillus sp. M6-12]PLS17342.1 methyltransferase [Bacillus sp. M6-12]
MSNLGFRVLPVENRPDKVLVKEFESVVTPHISDNMARLSAIGPELRPYHKGGKLTGTALTVKTRPGDNLLVHKAIDMAEPGDVIVVDAGGETTNAIVGEIMMRIAQKKGINGFVINGAIRDLEAIKEDVFPVFAVGVTHRGPYKDGPGEINVPISIGGTIVKPGDIVVGDDDGVVVVPAEDANRILQLVKAQQIRESEILESIENGTVDRSWVDASLREKGCEIIDTADQI